MDDVPRPIHYLPKEFELQEATPLPSRTYLPIQYPDGSFYSDPGHLFLCATVETTVPNILNAYEEVIQDHRAYALKRRDQRYGRDEGNRQHAAHTLLELFRSKQRGTKACTLEEAYSRVVQQEHDFFSDPTNDGRRATAWRKRREGEEIDPYQRPKAMDTVKKAFRKYRPVLHFLAAAWSMTGSLNKIQVCAEEAEKCLGVARGYQDFLDEFWPEWEFELIRVPEQIAPISPDRIKVKSAYFDDPYPEKLIRHNK